MNCIVVYSSVTGNTRSVAEAIHGVMPAGALIAPVHKAPPPEEFDFLALGFWVRRARPDPRMIRYMQRVRGKQTAWFGTLAAWPHSEHGLLVRKNTAELLQGNVVLGGFLCQGRLAPKRFAEAMGRGPDHPTHPLTEERKARLIEASRHPDESDFAAAREEFKRVLQACRM